MGRTKKAVTYEQIKKIHVLAKERGMDNDLLHEHMEMLVGKSSIRVLTKQEAITLIDSLEGKAGNRNVKDRATAKQMYYIYGLMNELGWTTGEGKPDLDRLNRFLRSDKAGFNLEDYRWLNIGTASNLIEALKAMIAREQEKKVAE
ncbi:MAG: DUF1018 domain-containing protein [Clostridia bacterium]|nr:DUF1018 domain-containing protein [Clostridia bacterium]